MAGAMHDMPTDIDIDLVKKRFGLKVSFSLKREQLECIQYLIHGKDVLCILPTGFGKSFPFFLFPYIYDSLDKGNRLGLAASYISIIVTPLKSLMRNMQLQYREMGFSVGCWLDTDQEEKAG